MLVLGSRARHNRTGKGSGLMAALLGLVLLKWISLVTVVVIVMAITSAVIAEQDRRSSSSSIVHEGYPVVISTWAFTDAVRTAWNSVEAGSSALDAVVEGCSACEKLRCDGTVGPGGSPDENGETTLDAMVMDGVTMEVGAVGALRNVAEAVRAAKLVMKHTKHTLLVGDQASAFAISMGLAGPKNLSSAESLEKWQKWKENNCQPNYWKDVLPKNACGPYHPTFQMHNPNGVQSLCNGRCSLATHGIMHCRPESSKHVTYLNHDTISMAVIDKLGHIAVGTSTNGASFKIPGRVGDGPIGGAGAYADQEVGACGATGDGDIMMRFLPCYQVVESMRQGMNPKNASVNAILRIKRKYPDFVGAIFAINIQGIHSGACHGWTFKYSVKSPRTNDVEVFTVYPDV